jgi:hypothetical protein
MTLRKRLAKLEAQREVTHTGPRVVMFNACWRDDEGNLQSIAQIAHVLTPSGWQTITRKEEEAEAVFHLRAEALAGDVGAGSAWAMAALKRKHASLDPG